MRDTSWQSDLRNPVCGLLILLLTACESGSSQQGDPTTPDDSATGAANPAALFCLEKGYRLQQVQVDEIRTNTLCIDEAGHKCPVWQYYRGECRLE